MGISGAGKTVVGRALAASLGWTFLDADDFHPEANRQKMHAGIPLTDEDRLPWLERLNAELRGRREPAVLACSALRESYRVILRRDLPELRSVFLAVDAETIRARVKARAGHFFPEALVDSQLKTLELPRDALIIDGTRPIEESVTAVRHGLGLPADGPVGLPA